MVMPSFEKSPPDLVERFGELAALVPDAERRKMFGYPACFLGGNMFMSLHEHRLVLRLGEGDRQALREAQPDVAVFEPMPGRPMREYLVVPPSMVAGTAVEEWVLRARAHAASMPAKPPRAKGGARRTRG